MAARIEKDGWVVSGETVEELEMAILAIQRATSATPASPEKRGPGRPPGVTDDVLKKRKRRFDRRKNALLTFLGALNDAGNEGIEADALAKKCKVNSISTHAANIARWLDQIGYKPEEVYQTSKSPKGKTLWIGATELHRPLVAAKEWEFEDNE